jgi:hypothetical protein
MSETTKKCSRCQTHKGFDYFSKWKNGTLGLDNTCKECRSRDRKNNRWDKEWSKNNPDKRKEITKRTNTKIRLECLNKYSNNDIKCSCCGENNIEFMSIDHIDGGGTQQRRDLGGSIYQWLRQNNYPDGFRILCHNCNSSLGYYGYCPHEKEKNAGE